MNPTKVNPATPILQNPFVRMEPLAKDHRERLRAAANEDANIFTYMPTDLSGDGFDAWMDGSLCQSTELVWTVIDIIKNQVVGSTRYLNIESTHKRVEIGATWYAPRFWGGVVNPSCKYLLFQYGFETLGLNRIELKTDARNAHSRAAIAKLGAREEGTLRRHMIVQDGYVRDTTYFSVIATEWPAVKAALLARLASFE
jgi:RimJ/RimL family protein N-acetyltransferase